jgi:hypothetical protein
MCNVQCLTCVTAEYFFLKFFFSEDEQNNRKCVKKNPCSDQKTGKKTSVVSMFAVCFLLFCCFLLFWAGCCINCHGLLVVVYLHCIPWHCWTTMMYTFRADQGVYII